MGRLIFSIILGYVMATGVIALIWPEKWRALPQYVTFPGAIHRRSAKVIRTYGLSTMLFCGCLVLWLNEVVPTVPVPTRPLALIATVAQGYVLACCLYFVVRPEKYGARRYAAEPADDLTKKVTRIVAAIFALATSVFFYINMRDLLRNKF